MKAAKIFLAVIFIMAISLGVKAQDKYEYAVVTFQCFAKKNLLSISTKDKYDERELPPSSGKMAYSLSQVLEEVDKMSDQGWEVYANNLAVDLTPKFVYYLRKKKG